MFRTIRSAIGWFLLVSNLFLTAAHILLFQVRLSVVERLCRQQGFGRRNLAILRLICGLDCHVKGLENLPDPPFVIVSNHQSTFETIAFQAIFPPFVWVLKESLTRVPIIGAALRRLGPIAIKRESRLPALKQVLREGRAYLNAGLPVLIFPEGTRYQPGQLGPMAGSAVALARRAAVPIVPVLHNAGEYWPPYSAMIRPGHVTVWIGKSISAEFIATANQEDILRKLGSRLKEEI